MPPVTMSTESYAGRVRSQIRRAKENRLAFGDFMSESSWQAPMKRRPPRGVRGRGVNVRNLLMAVGGIGSFNAELCIPQMFLMPRTTDPDNASTIMIIEGLQRGLNRVIDPTRGGQLEVNGLLVPETVQAIRTAAGSAWMSKTWVQIYGDVAEMMKRKLTLSTILPKEKSHWPSAANPHVTPVGDVISVGDAFTTIPLVTLAGGVALLFLAASMTKG